MQILFLVKDSDNLWQESSEKLAPILAYHKALSQNILLTDIVYLNDSFAQKCLILNRNTIEHNVMLSPSLIINLYTEKSQTQIERYFRVSWPNVQMAFWNRKYMDKTYFNNFKEQKGLLEAIAYTPNLKEPTFKLIEKSVENHYFLGLIEQAITEYFADRNIYKVLKLNPTSVISKNRSLIFKFQYSFKRQNGDYKLTIESVTFLDLFELLQINKAYLYEYFDEILTFRYDYYLEQVKLRQYISDLCNEHDIDFEPSILRTFVLIKGDKVGLHRPYFGGVNDLKGIDTINDKHLTNVILKDKGFNTNLSYEYMLQDLNSPQNIENIQLEYPLVLKPTNKKKGYGVVTNILNPQKMLHSVQELLALGDIAPVLVEEFFQGMTYRVLVVAGEVIAVLKFMPTYIIGNGKSTIEELIHSKNILLRSRIRLIDSLELGIKNDGYDMQSVLPKGFKYILSHNSHASMGGQATNVTDIFNEELKQISCEVSKCLDLPHIGIDMNVNEKGDYRILEVNCAPALSSHLYPKYGTPVDTYSKVLDAFFSHTDTRKRENRYLLEMVKYHK